MKILHKRKLDACGIIFLCIFCLFSTTSVAASDYWPTSGWRMSSPEEQGMHSKPLADMLALIRGGYKIDNVTIVRNGYIVVDAYFSPFSKGQKHILYSATKSILSALIGIAIDQGHIKNVDQPIIDFFPDRTLANLDELKKSITLENFLTMASGLKCRDSHQYRWVGLSEMCSSNDWAQYVLDLPMVEPPGTRFEYCNGVSYLLSVIIQETTGTPTLDFARNFLFKSLGITDIRWRTSPQGFGYGAMWLTPRDMAKFGWLYLNKGRWEDKQILPSAWIEVSTRGHIPATFRRSYGYQWWVHPAGFYEAIGYRGQFIFVVPSKNLVVVFTSDLPDRYSFTPVKLLKDYIIPAAASSQPLHLNPKEKARLDSIQYKIAKASKQGFIWTSEKEGVAKDGVFKRTVPPGFKFTYPLYSTKTPRRDIGQVLRMKIHNGGIFSASVVDAPKGMKAADFGPKFYAPSLEYYGTDIQIRSNKEIRLKDGTPAYRTDIQWLQDFSIHMTTRMVSVFKGSKCVILETHAAPWDTQERLVPILESLTFD